MKLRALAACVAATTAMSVVSVTAAELPERIKESKTIRVAINNSFPPLNYTDVNTKELTGFNVELLKALGTKLGVKMDLVIMTFPQYVPALDTGRVDFIGAGITGFQELQKTMSFAEYLLSGPQLITAESNTATLKSTSDVCGKKVGYIRFVQAFAKVIETFSANECVAKGLAPVTLVSDETPEKLGLAQGRYDAALVAIESFLYLTQTEPGTVARVGEPLEPWPLGMVFKKDDTEFRDAIAEGIDALMADGTYTKILKQFHLDEMGMTKTTIDSPSPW